jgi:hypothetical protein
VAARLHHLFQRRLMLLAQGQQLGEGRHLLRGQVVDVRLELGAALAHAKLLVRRHVEPTLLLTDQVPRLARADVRLRHRIRTIA